MNIQLIRFNLIHLLLLIVGMQLTLKTTAEEQTAAFIEGVDYSLIDKIETGQAAQLSELESINNIEIFYWYGCEPCYQVEAAIGDYLQQNPNLSLRRTPLIIRLKWRQQAYIQPLMQQLSQIENLPNIIQIYQQCLIDCELLSDFPSILNWFSSKIETPLPTINESKIWQAEKNYRKRADLFSILQVPTIIINESYKIDANQAQTAKRLVEIIDFLLSK